MQLTAGPKGAHFVLIGGEPIDEPVVQYGPFVMTTGEEIRQAFMDYQLGKNGFERAVNWKSSAVRNNPSFEDDD